MPSLSSLLGIAFKTGGASRVVFQKKINILHTIFKEFKFYSDIALQNSCNMPLSLSKSVRYPPVLLRGDESWRLNTFLDHKE
jgi:hypothetical protein